MYAVFAGKGSLPKLVIAELGNPKVICFEGEQNPEIKPDLVTRFGKVGLILDYLRENNIKKIIFAGAMQRPDLKTLSPDVEGAKLLAKIFAGSFFSKGFGDDKLLSLLTEFLESKGFEVVGVHEILKEILAPKGLLGKVGPVGNQENDIKIAIEVLRKIGALDIGQAVIVEDGIVLAIEAAEGTANMIERAGKFKKSYGGVLVKFKKPEQLDKADLPAIGPDTIGQIKAAGIAGIAVEAGVTILLDREEIIKMADAADVFVLGI